MSRRLLLLGSGKMARNTGVFFLKKRWSVSWVSRDPGRLAQLERAIEKHVRRLRRLDPDRAGKMQIRFFLPMAADIPEPDVIIESINESLDDKRAIVAAVAGLFTPGTLLLSNSSSIMPGQIHEACMGLHFFYPVELTGLVEIIFPGQCPQAARKKVVELVGECGLQAIVQDKESAFAANRLLLPMQAEAFRLLRDGVRPEDVDSVSASELLPAGQLSMMDTIGLDVIHASVPNYLERMPPEEAAGYEPLTSGLAGLLDMGKRGAKNRDGLLSGSPLPWPPRAQPAGEDRAALAKRFLYLAVNACMTFLENRIVSRPSLGLITGDLWQSDTTIEDVIKKEKAATIFQFLENLYKKGGLSYYRPSKKLIKDC